MSPSKLLCGLAALFLLMSCAPTFAPPTEGARAPMAADEAIIARDGVRLPLRRWEATGEYAGKPRAVIVGLHGMSDYSNAFAMPGAVLAKAGITTLAYDQRGFGKSETPGIWAGADTMRSDLNDAVAAARARYPGAPVFVLGESMGGAVVLTALASAEPPAVDGVILVAPAVWSRGDMPVLYRLALFMGAHLLPDMILSNNAGARIKKITASDNVPMLIALGKDPLFQKQTRTATLYGLVNLMDEARTAPAKIGSAPPILFLYGAKDQIIPKEPTEAVIAGLGGKAKVKRYEQGYHMLLRDLEGERVDHDIADWIAGQARNS
jgi:acylglycerol lipase